MVWRHSMTKLSYSALVKALQFAREIHEIVDLEELRRVIPQLLQRLVSCDRAALNEFEIHGRGSIVPSPVPTYWNQLGGIFQAHFCEHGLMRFGGRCGQVVSFGDRAHDSEWKHSVLYNDYYVPAGIRHQLAVNVVEQGSVRLMLNCNRGQRDFSVEDRALLELVTPHVATAWRNAAERAQWRGDGTSAVAIPPSGTARVPTPTSNERKPPSTDAIPQARLEQLTAREQQILHWVAEGKRNAEIGVILNLSGRTVGKHLEHVFEKLGVETRTAAALMATSIHNPRGGHA